MKTLNIALYFFCDLDGILESILKHPNPIQVKPFFIDPYPASTSNWESDIKLYANQTNELTRVIWNSMEGEKFRSFRNIHDLSSIFPYSSERRITEFIKYSSKTEKLLPKNSYESIYMSQRTLAGLKSHIDLITYMRKAHQFWVDYLKFCKIDALISTNVPHAFTDFLLTEACRTLGIPCICSDLVNMSKGSYYINLTTNRHVENVATKENHTVELRELKEIIESNTLSDTNMKNIYSEELNIQAEASKQKINSFLMSGSLESQIILENKLNLAKQYDKHAELKSIPSNADRYHYLFLHYQPEASSIPLAREYADQLRALEYILSVAGEDDCIIVKEHPRQFIEYGNVEQNIAHIKNVLNYRGIHFYQECLQIDSVFLCPRNVGTRTILKNTKTTVWSPTGTINLQAFLSGCDFNCFDTYSPYKYLMPYKNSPIGERKEIAFNVLSKFVWKSFKLDFQSQMKSKTAGETLIQLIDTISL